MVPIVHRIWSKVSRLSTMFEGLLTPGGSHFGSDTAGVNTTRRFLCESLSFQHRYVPIGLLEVLPGRINDRPPLFKGRDELGIHFSNLSLNHYLSFGQKLCWQAQIAATG